MNDRARIPLLFDDSRFFSALLGADPTETMNALGGFIHVDDPRSGEVAPGEWDDFVLETATFWGTWSTVYQPLHRIATPQRIVTEGLWAGRRDGVPFAIPTCAVADATPRALRLYYTLWPLTHSHRVRPPVAPGCGGARLGDVIAVYQQALAAGNGEAVLRCFEPDGCVREPSGAPFVHCGHAALRRLYSAMFDCGGGIPLRHCTTTDDGVSCAIEYNVTRWGNAALAPQAGVAVYVRSAGGRLQAARIYDDVKPPFE